MIRSILALAVTAVLLCGCVLQSKKPLYGDQQSVLALGPEGGNAITSNWQNGMWVPDTDTVTIQVVGTHYEATSNSSAVILHFIPLQGPWYVLQATEVGNTTAYLLAQINNGGADAYPLACRDLKQRGDLSAWIEFTGDDCIIRPDAALDPLFAALIKTPGEPSSRIEIKR
jgi:hypothetical protein